MATCDRSSIVGGVTTEEHSTEPQCTIANGIISLSF